jgi:hypothetical protein
MKVLANTSVPHLLSKVVGKRIQLPLGAATSHGSNPKSIDHYTAVRVPLPSRMHTDGSMHSGGSVWVPRGEMRLMGLIDEWPGAASLEEEEKYISELFNTSFRAVYEYLEKGKVVEAYDLFSGVLNAVTLKRCNSSEDFFVCYIAILKRIVVLEDGNVFIEQKRGRNIVLVLRSFIELAQQAGYSLFLPELNQLAAKLSDKFTTPTPQGKC